MHASMCQAKKNAVNHVKRYDKIYEDIIDLTQ